MVSRSKANSKKSVSHGHSHGVGGSAGHNTHSSGSGGRDKGKYRYRIEIEQMMFVSGELNDPPEATTELIEDIVRDQVVQLILRAQKTANARGQRAISPEDVIFMIRHDRAKVNRLRTYLSWKDVRKNAREQENGDITAGNDIIDGNGASGSTVHNNDGSSASGGNQGGGASGVDKQAIIKQKKSLRLPWELEFMFSEQPLYHGDEVYDDVDEDEREALRAQMKRLKQNDDRTKYMTKKEYVHWSECRQASFTFRKAKRFREWCGMSQISESRPNDDVIDILGFLTFELVCTITEEALKVKKALGDFKGAGPATKRRKVRHIFDKPEEDSTPIQAIHIQEAWRYMQKTTAGSKALYNFRGGRIKSQSQMI